MVMYFYHLFLVIHFTAKILLSLTLEVGTNVRDFLFGHLNFFVVFDLLV